MKLSKIKKKFIYLISPNKIKNNNFYVELRKIFKLKKVAFFQLRLKKESKKKKIIIAKKIQKAKTDPMSLPNDIRELTQRPEARNLINIYAALKDVSVANAINELQGVSFKNFKSKLTELAIEVLLPISQEINKLLNDHRHLDNILKVGSEQAYSLASPIVDRSYEIVGLLSTKK